VLFAQTRTETRRFLRDAWHKRCQGLTLDPLETIVADVVAAHPEYQQAVAEDVPDSAFDADPTDNPFLHLGLHVALVEQLQADRPPGIRAEFIRLKSRHEDGHAAEHQLLQVLAETLWIAQSRGTLPDAGDYLARVRRLN